MTAPRAATPGDQEMLAALGQPLAEAVRPWRVLHVCESARRVWPVVEGQLTAGMRPTVLTPQGYRVVLEPTPPPGDRPRPLSLLAAWQEVRGWRESMLEASLASSAEVVHAHSFASGMSAVRNCPVVVYDVHAFVEELAAEPASSERRSWLARSFRVAEQFVIARASAVVVHSSAMRERVFERGALPGNVFVVPAPVSLESDGPLQLAGENETVVFFAADVCAAGVPLGIDVLSLLRTFSIVAAECENSRLRLRTAVAASAAVLEVARAMGIAERIEPVRAENASEALASADVVVAAGKSEAAAVEALRHGRALLAADVPSMRDVTVEGRGCLWYDAHDAGDLPRRAAFLARNPEFRRALAAGGYEHLRATRSALAVGRKYDEVYRHAMTRRRNLAGGASHGSLLPIRACL